MRGREYWIELVLPGEPPSDAICVQLDEGSKRILDLKRSLLSEIESILPGPTGLPWITIKLAPQDDLEEYKALASSALLTELPETAGSSDWHLQAHIRLINSIASESSQQSSSKKEQKPKIPRTLFEKGIAGKDEPEHIRNAERLEDLYPGGKLPPKISNTLDLSFVLRLGFTCVFMFALGIGIVFCLEHLPLWLQNLNSSPGHVEL